MNSFLKKSVLALVLFNLVACGSDDESLEIMEQGLTGTIDGQEWAFVQGKAREDADNGTVFVTMWGETVEDPCSQPLDSDVAQILTSLKPEIGAGELEFGGESLTFSYGDFQNDVSFEGQWRIDEVTDDKIVGGLAAKAFGHTVSGTFELTRCPDPFADR